VEIGRFLTEVARFPNCVPLAGVIEHVDKDGGITTLGLLQAYVRNQGDGWNYTLEYLGRFLDTHRATAEVPPDVHGAYLALVQTLGVRTAELHAAFAKHTGDGGFDPEPATQQDYAAWKERVREDAASAFDLLARRLDQLPATVVDEARSITERRDEILRRIDGLHTPRGRVLKTRHHGDYHLGQVLLSKNDFIITDFEGEPARPVEERRRKHSPVRDVAGMVRSFSYAAGAGLARAIEVPEDEARLGRLAADWEAQTRNVFLRAYDETARSAGIYSDEADFHALLDLFELEKALYELRYELNNRPDWVRWPLAGISRLLQ
jgi:maltose alpha-D-glucosyltransferase/alpha-amylase